jgi:signal transduction histidine kinase
MMVGILGSSLIVLAASWVYGALVPDLTASSVSGREALRMAAYGLILAAALMSRAHQQRAEASEAAVRERRRLVRDLHDGMAQDLAYIAAHGERLARDLGPEHPIAIAARRALAASRGAVLDLSASDAPNTREALHAVAEELSVRHGIHVCVVADGDDLTADEREAVVRIAREAIVNAAQHGGARNVEVSLRAQGGKLALSVWDDGHGLRKEARDIPSGGPQDSHNGYGLKAMRERAEAMGGEFNTRSPACGGTAVEVLVS